MVIVIIVGPAERLTVNRFQWGRAALLPFPRPLPRYFWRPLPRPLPRMFGGCFGEVADSKIFKGGELLLALACLVGRLVDIAARSLVMQSSTAVGHAVSGIFLTLITLSLCVKLAVSSARGQRKKK